MSSQPEGDAGYLSTIPPTTGGAGAPAETISSPGRPVGGAARARPERIGGIRIGQYELIRMLSRGGMGEVYLARDTRLGRLVAMKFVMRSSPSWNERFLREARTTAQCTHENIVVVHEVDEHEGSPYMVLEYLEGAALRQVMAGRRMPPGRAVELMVPVVRALAHAHDSGIVHRDLKPENVFVTAAGTIKVLDFGLATLFAQADASLAGAAPPAREDVGEPPGSEAGALIGTLPYMSPEQFGAGEIDHRTDLWAVGVMLYEMVTGRHPLEPFSRQSLVENARDLGRPMPSVGQEVADLPPRLARCIDRCLAKRKAERIADARELCDELEPLAPRHRGRQLEEDESPFPGLAAFQEADADRFFGRSPEVGRAVTRLRELPLVGIAGPSGVGKSSFVRAGVVPALKASGEAWEVLVMRPGRTPLESLASLLLPLVSSRGARADVEEAERLRRGLIHRLTGEPGYLGLALRTRALEKRCQILLFLDQFEELYTLVPDAAERAAFVASLAGMADDAAAPLRLVVAMRSDLLDRVAEDRRFLEALTRGLVFLQPLGGEGLEEALRQPLEMRGYGFEAPGTVAEMVGALQATPGALPLLQFAATRLWEGRDRQRRVLTRASYEAMGGIAGVLASHADQVLAGLSPAAQRLARALLPRLVTPEGTRAIVDVAELAALSADGREVALLVDQLVAARLLVANTQGETPGVSAVELVHESLIQGWPTLRRWLDDSKEDAAFLGQLRAAARQWEAKRRPQGLLWRGEALDEARLFRARYRGELVPGERAYLEAALALGERAVRLRRVAVAAVIGFLLVAVLVGSVALVTIRRAERAAVENARRAHVEAERAGLAEQRVKEQLELFRAEQAARQQADTAVKLGKERLGHTNARLAEALATAEQESRSAQAAAAREKKLADSLRRANQLLEEKVAREKERADQAEREGRKINRKLK